MKTQKVGRSNAKHVTAAIEVIPQTALEERQALLAHHVRMVARGMSNGLFAVGPGGLGKSLVISRTLIEEGVVPVVLNSHVTPLGLYTTMFHHRKDAVIWMDDADAAYTNLPILGLLRSALWGQGERIVTYTSSQLQGVPSSFSFTSRVICTANVVPKRNEPFRAVLSRVDVFELTATNDDVLELMRTMAAKGFNDVPGAMCLEVVEYVARAGGSRQLSVRLFESSMRKVEYALQTGTDWRELVRSQLDQLGQPEGVLRPLDSKAHHLKCMAVAVERHPASVRLQEEVWREMTGKSRASFFRAKRDCEAQKQSDQT
jgi:hypothetical protein